MELIRESLEQDLDRLSNPQLQQVADFIAFLKFRDRPGRTIDVTQFAAIADFAEDDRSIAEAGMEDYIALLPQEDYQFIGSA